MKKLFLVLMVLLLVCGCGKSEPGKQEEPTNQKEPQDVPQNVDTGNRRYFIYVGAENLEGGSQLNIPTVNYNGHNYLYTDFLPLYRYARYIKINEENKGVHVTVDVNEKKVDNYYEPVFTVTEEEVELWFGEGAKIGKNFTSCFLENGTLHLDYELFKEVDEDTINGILNGTTGYKDLKNAKVGDKVVFGKYEQDICLSNGSDPIVWRVLEIKDGKALLLSEDVIDDHMFNNKQGDTTWETSSLRSFLNNDFYNDVFSDEEKAKIVNTHNENNSYADYLSSYWLDNSYIEFNNINNVNNGNATDDKVFVLDLGEIRQYLGNEDGYYPTFASQDNGPKDYLGVWSKFGINFDYAAGGRISRPSEAIVRWSTVGFSTYHQDTTKHYANYWTRTMADNNQRAIAINDIGAFISFPTTADNVGVRPAIWVEVN